MRHDVLIGSQYEDNLPLLIWTPPNISSMRSSTAKEIDNDIDKSQVAGSYWPLAVSFAIHLENHREGTALTGHARRQDGYQRRWRT